MFPNSFSLTPNIQQSSCQSSSLYPVSSVQTVQHPANEVTCNKACACSSMWLIHQQHQEKEREKQWEIWTGRVWNPSVVWTAVEWMICQEAIRHMRWDWAELCVFVCLWICKCCSHYDMQASEPQQERLWHVCFQQQISERRESYGDPPTADVIKELKQKALTSDWDLERSVMDITKTRLPRFLQIYALWMQDRPGLIEMEFN